MSELISLFKKLPIELHNSILSYTLKPQSKELLEDIKSFNKMKEEIIEIYKNIFDDEYDRTCWLNNDIVRYMNEDMATMNGYTEFHYKIFKRLFKLSSKSNKFILKNTQIISQNPMSDFNIRFGLLTNLERINFKNFIYDNIV